MSLAEARRQLELTRRQLERAIRESELSLFTFKGSKVRYVRACQVRNLRRRLKA